MSSSSVTVLPKRSPSSGMLPMIGRRSRVTSSEFWSNPPSSSVSPCSTVTVVVTLRLERLRKLGSLVVDRTSSTLADDLERDAAVGGDARRDVDLDAVGNRALDVLRPPVSVMKIWPPDWIVPCRC